MKDIMQVKDWAEDLRVALDDIVSALESLAAGQVEEARWKTVTSRTMLGDVLREMDERSRGE